MSTFNDNIQKEVNDVISLISLPEIYLKVRQLMDDETSSIDDFTNVIQLDPNLSAAVLRMVNSVYFGLSKKIDSLSQSINIIGIGQLYNMVLAV